MSDDPPVRRGDWTIQPMPAPQPIPGTARLWTNDEVARLRLGSKPRDMDDRWFSYMEGDRLFLHRSWSGFAVFEAQFTETDGGWRISQAVVNGDPEQYRRGTDAAEATSLEGTISLVLDTVIP